METWAHPRSRGENHTLESGVIHKLGSSPLTRGKRWCQEHLAFIAGLIPAHAGKTCQRGSSRESRQAHPRSRGENRRANDARSTPRGSSPLTRGKPAVAEGMRAIGGLIPAHAGKTAATARAKEYAEAHPRSRGENTS